MANTKITTNVIADGAITSAKLDSSSLSIPSTATATTQSAGDNSTKVATTAYVETAVSNLISAAPAALDTLDELAAALGDDANFATTVTDSLALKAPLASPDFTGDVTFDTSTLVVDSTNNRVGIGTASPSALLHVAGDARIGAAGATSQLMGMVSSGGVFEITTSSSVGKIYLARDVGIGTDNPDRQLEIYGTNDGYMKFDGGRSGNHGFTIGSDSSGFIIYDDTSSAYRFVIDQDTGNVGIGDTTPSEKLEVAGNIAVSGTVDGRDIASDGSKLDGIESGATADQTASEILTAIKTVDGSGSGLDADLLDGKQPPTNWAATAQTYTTIASGGWDLPTGSSVFSTSSSSGGPGDDGYWFVTGHRDTAGGFSGIYTPHNDGNFYVGFSSTDSNPTWYTVWTSGSDGPGSGLNADLLDGVQGSSYLRSDATDTFTTLNGTQLNLGSQVQLRESTDRPDLLQITSSTSTWAGLQVRNSSNEGRWSFMTDGSVAGIYDDENGKWHIQMDENGETRLYNNATERITATSVGADILGQLYVDSTTDAKFILQGSADPYMVFKEGTTDKCHIGWDSTNTRMFFTAIEDNSGGGTQGNFIFKSGDADDPVKIALAASDSDIFGYIYGSHANDVGFLDDDASWAYRISTDSQHEWRVNDVVLATLTSGQLTFNTPSTINGVVDLYVDDQIISTGDTDTYLQFHAANQFRIVTGGTEMLEVNDTYVQLGAALNANNQQLLNVEDIGLNDQIFHDGDTNTYIQFHAADQWRVVTGGTERLEVNNSLTTIATPLTVQGENNIFSNGNAGIYFTNGGTSPTFASHGGIARSAGTNFHVSGSTVGDLCISAESGKHIMFGDANTQNARLEDNGNFIAAGSVTGSSDERLKDNVQTIQNALEKTMGLRGVTFTRNDIVDSPEKIGVIAQEVEQILPQVVVTAEDEDGYKSVAYGEMVALLIEATKEQQALIETLQTRIETLEGNYG